MSYSKTTDNGVTWEQRLQPDSVPRTETGSTNPETWKASGWYPDAVGEYPADTPDVCRMGIDNVNDPTLVAEEAVWGVIYLEGTECANAQRDAYTQEINDQIPTITLTDKAKDSTAEAKVEQVVLRAEQAKVSLVHTPDEDLPTFNPNLENYNSTQTAYAANMVTQETRNLALHNELVAAGDQGLYSVAEVSAIESRVSNNGAVARGEQTGVETPSIGAPRQDVALDGESTADCVFEEISFEWNSQIFYIPLVTLPVMPDDVTTSQVYAMIYDQDNVYIGWMPFAQDGDGFWRTPSDVNYASIAKGDSSRWRVAVSYQGTSAEYEITRRVRITPPETSISIVRWYGRID